MQHTKEPWFAYRAGGHLKKYSRESKETHEQRQARAVYFNYIQPIVDILVGFIFRNPVEREIPSLVEPLKENLATFPRLLAGYTTRLPLSKTILRLALTGISSRSDGCVEV